MHLAQSILFQSKTRPPAHVPPSPSPRSTRTNHLIAPLFLIGQDFPLKPGLPPLHGEWKKATHRSDSCPTSAASNGEHNVVDGVTTAPLISVPEAVPAAESITFANGGGKTSLLSSENNASSKQEEEEERRGEEQDGQEGLSTTTDHSQSDDHQLEVLWSSSSRDHSENNKQSGERGETEQQLLVRSVCVNAGAQYGTALVRAKDDPFGRAITRWRHSHTANDTKPFPLSGQDCEAELWLAVRQRHRAAAAERGLGGIRAGKI